MLTPPVRHHWMRTRLAGGRRQAFLLLLLPPRLAGARRRITLLLLLPLGLAGAWRRGFPLLLLPLRLRPDSLSPLLLPPTLPR